MSAIKEWSVVIISGLKVGYPDTMKPLSITMQEMPTISIMFDNQLRHSIIAIYVIRSIFTGMECRVAYAVRMGMEKY